MRRLELLAPAKNLECGMAAIDHGADAVYIGAPHFGARAAAGNSIDDIRRLCDYAHPFGAKVYVTVNTIIYDDELDEARQLLDRLDDARVDAILVQDMALVNEKSRVKCGFHASTQTDNRTPEKVVWLRDLGFSRVVLARELTLSEIRAIHEAVPDVELEVFVHGALCVSYSGLCYASQHCFNRSANRGECAQFCRMAFDLVDADGRVVEHNRHLLSLKDMNQIDNLKALAEAGATSFKIEGRLKDLAYVKNVTAAYSQRLNQLVSSDPDSYCRASHGHCRYTFTPNLNRTFNRGYTDYFLYGRQPGIVSFDTPKAIGEFVGTVERVTRHDIVVTHHITAHPLRGVVNDCAYEGEGKAAQPPHPHFINGDGLCFFDDQRQLQGFRVNRAEGNRLFPQHVPVGLKAGMRLFRNNDQELERLLSKPSAERKILVTMTLEAFPDDGQGSGFRLTVSDGRQQQTASIHAELQLAQTPQLDNIFRQLTKLGGTPYECASVNFVPGFSYFIPASRLAELRRAAIARMLETVSANPSTAGCPSVSSISSSSRTSSCSSSSSSSRTSSNPSNSSPPPSYPQPHLYNIANSQARDFYHTEALTAYELRPRPNAMLMQCRHCLRYSLGHCVKHGGKQPAWREPLSLRLSNGRSFPLEFDCRHCQMNVYASGEK